LHLAHHANFPPHHIFFDVALPLLAAQDVFQLAFHPHRADAIAVGIIFILRQSILRRDAAHKAQNARRYRARDVFARGGRVHAHARQAITLLGDAQRQRARDALLDGDGRVGQNAADIVHDILDAFITRFNALGHPIVQELRPVDHADRTAPHGQHHVLGHQRRFGRHAQQRTQTLKHTPLVLLVVWQISGHNLHLEVGRIPHHGLAVAIIDDAARRGHRLQPQAVVVRTRAVFIAAHDLHIPQAQHKHAQHRQAQQQQRGDARIIEASIQVRISTHSQVTPGGVTRR